MISFDNRSLLYLLRLHRSPFSSLFCRPAQLCFYSSMDISHCCSSVSCDFDVIQNIRFGLHGLLYLNFCSLLPKLRQSTPRQSFSRPTNNLFACKSMYTAETTIVSRDCGYQVHCRQQLLVRFAVSGSRKEVKLPSSRATTCPSAPLA